MFGYQWHLTDRCNRRCRHCYQNSHADENLCDGADGRRQAALAVLGAIPTEAVTVNLTGGEPLLLPDLVELARYLESFANLDEINIITNGTIEDQSLLQQLGSLPRLKSFRISLESGDRSVNDYIRGDGSLEGLRRTIPLYKKMTGKQITLMVTLSRLNFATVVETIRFATQVGADAILFERFVPMGTGMGIADAVLTADDWFEVVGRVVEAAGLDADIDSLAAYRAFGLLLDRNIAAEDRLEAALCNLGSESMAMMPDGTVYPCRRLDIPVGNIFSEPFLQIRSRLSEWECAKIRPKLTGVICGACPFEDCPGCRALARAVYGSPFADDPQCLLNRSSD